MSIWKDEAVRSKAFELRNAGMSANEIAARLEAMTQTTLTRNAVLGFFHRKGYRLLGNESKHASPKKQKQKRKRAWSRSQSEQEPPTKHAARPQIMPDMSTYQAAMIRIKAIDDERREHATRLIDLEPTSCPWVLDEPKDQKCCGADKAPGLPYCERHARMAYKVPNMIDLASHVVDVATQQVEPERELEAEHV